MARGSFPLYGLNGGEVSRNALARVDIAKMRLAAQCQVNWLPLVIGPAMLRPGLLNVGEVANDNATQLIDFVYAKTDTALLELTPNVMRVWISDVLLARVAVGTAISDPNFGGGGAWTTSNTTAGATATISGGTCTLLANAIGSLAQIQQQLTIAGGDQGSEHALRVVVSNGPVTIRVGSSAGAFDYLNQTIIDSGTHSLPFTPTGSAAYIQIESTDQWNKTLTQVSIEAAGVVTLPTPWGAGDLANLRWDQSGDIVYIASYGLQQYKIERRGTRPGARGWSVVLYRSSNGPFQDGPGSSATLTLNANSGTTTLSSSTPYFRPTHVGALFQLFVPTQTEATAIVFVNSATPAIRVAGVQADRDFTVTVTGTWSGTLNVQRSIVGPTEGFVSVGQDNSTSPNSGSITSNTSLTWSDGVNSAHSGVLGFDNVVAWYRVVFGTYTSGVATVTLGYNGGGGNFGICRVLSYINTTSVNVEVLQPCGGPTPTASWQESAWSGYAGWPTSVSFQEGRLWWFGAPAFPIAGSQSNNFTGYGTQDEFGNDLGDAGAILEDFGSGPQDTVTWVLPLQRLLCGREQSIASIRSSSIDTPLTPTSFIVKDCCQQGAARMPALKFGQRGIFVQQNGQKVYELTITNPYLADYNDRDLTRLNLDIGKPGFIDTTRALQPDGLALFPRGDGQLACLLYDPNDEVEAWWRLMTLGVVERSRVLPNWAGGADDFVYLVVRRTINGVARRFIEKLAQRKDCVGGALNQQLDAALVHTGAAIGSSTISWLPNTLISVWADGAAIGTTTTDGSGNFTMPDGNSHSNFVAGLAGAVLIGSTNSPLSNNVQPIQIFTAAQGTLTVGNQYNGYPAEVFADIGGTGRPLQHIGSLVVAGGIVTLPNSQVASTIVACLGYVAPFQSAKLAYGAPPGGTALAQKKKIDHLGLILYDAAASGLTFGQDFAVLDPMPTVDSGQVTPAGTVWSEYDGPFIPLPGKWDTDARLCLLAQAPSPCTIGGVVLGMDTNPR
jgi:hypothetical protein